MDLFGHLPTADRKVTLPCAECGNAFDQPHHVGRLRRYCSDTCRKANWGRQIRQWEIDHPDKHSGGRECRHCGKPFDVPERTAGRLPRYCSPQCRRDFHTGRPVRLVDLPDLLNPQKRKEKP